MKVAPDQQQQSWCLNNSKITSNASMVALSKIYTSFKNILVYVMKSPKNSGLKTPNTLSEMLNVTYNHKTIGDKP